MDGTTVFGDLRERAVRGVATAASWRATTAKFEVSISVVVKQMQRLREGGTL